LSVISDRRWGWRSGKGGVREITKKGAEGGRTVKNVRRTAGAIVDHRLESKRRYVPGEGAKMGNEDAVRKVRGIINISTLLYSPGGDLAGKRRQGQRKGRQRAANL